MLDATESSSINIHIPNITVDNPDMIDEVQVIPSKYYNTTECVV